MAVLANRKRAAPVENGSVDESSAFESSGGAATPSRQKKARFQTPGDENETSVLAASIAPSLAGTNTATATIAETDTPHTEASSARSKSNPRPKKYQCTFPNCTKAFDRPIRLQTHINSHTGERPHACPHEDCDKRFQKPEHLNRHVKEKHGNERFTCTHKVRKDDTGIIEECGRVFESSTKLKRHIAVHEEKEETTCTWEGCGKVFRKQDTLQRHIKKDHLNEDSYICKRETADGDVCGQAFPTPGQLRGHETKEHSAAKYICQICTNAAVIPVEDMTPVDNGLDAAFLPTLEDLQFVGHEFDPNEISKLSLRESAGMGFQISGGLVSFPTYHDLQRHLKVAHPPVCDKCGKECRSGKDLAAHIDIHHSDGPSTRKQPEKKYLCPIEDCPRSMAGNGFTKKGNMEVHVKSTHAREKKFVCGEYDLGKDKKIEGWDGKGCGTALGARQGLIGHIRTQHLNLPPTIAPKNPRRKTQPKVKQENEEGEENAMETESQSAAPSKALSMLTGFGYEQRPYACLMADSPGGCPMRFTKEYELCSHMELTHGWNVDDISEAMGYEVDGFDEEMEDDTQRLRRELEKHVGGFNAAGREVQMVDPDLAGV